MMDNRTLLEWERDAYIAQRQRQRTRMEKLRRKLRAWKFASVILAAFLVFAILTALGTQTVDAAPEYRIEIEIVPTPLKIASAHIEEEVINEEPAEEDIWTDDVHPLEYLGEFVISHYCACVKCCGKDDGITATGTKATEGRTVAVDPSVIPYGTEISVFYDDGRIETYIAEDCGGAIKGNRLDVFCSSHSAALQAGMKSGSVYVEVR